MRWVAGLFVCLALAGCTDSTPGGENSEIDDDGSTMEWDTIRLAEPGFSMTDTLTGRFEFQENQYFVGHLYGMAGQDGGLEQVHDISHLLPADGLYTITMTVTSDPDNGDIDAWYDGDPIIFTHCECPFGGNIQVSAYAIGDGDVTITIQYDEISSGPADFGYAIAGFEYQIDVKVEAFAEGVPAGLPIGVTLNEAGQSVAPLNLTEPVTVYGPDDAQVAVLEPDAEPFVYNASMPAGEYVFIQQINGDPIDTRIGGETLPAYRVLGVQQDFKTLTYQPGGGGGMTFETVPGTIEFTACAESQEASVGYEFIVRDTNDDVWASDENTDGASVDYGNCFSNWFGGPDQQVGTWTVSFFQTAGTGIDLYAWAYYYVR